MFSNAVDDLRRAPGRPKRNARADADELPARPSAVQWPASAVWLVFLACVVRFQSTGWTIWRALGLLAFTLAVPVAVCGLGLFAVWVARGFRTKEKGVAR